MWCTHARSRRPSRAVGRGTASRCRASPVKRRGHAPGGDRARWPRCARARASRCPHTYSRHPITWRMKPSAESRCGTSPSPVRLLHPRRTPRRAGAAPVVHVGAEHRVGEAASDSGGHGVLVGTEPWAARSSTNRTAGGPGRPGALVAHQPDGRPRRGWAGSESPGPRRRARRGRDTDRCGEDRRVLRAGAPGSRRPRFQVTARSGFPAVHQVAELLTPVPPVEVLHLEPLRGRSAHPVNSSWWQRNWFDADGARCRAPRHRGGGPARELGSVAIRRRRGRGRRRGSWTPTRMRGGAPAQVDVEPGVAPARPAKRRMAAITKWLRWRCRPDSKERRRSPPSARGCRRGRRRTRPRCAG